MIQAASELALPAPNASDLAATFAAMDNDSLIELAGDAQAVLDRERAAYEERTARDRAVVAAAQATILQRIIDAGGTALPHDRYDVRIKQTKSVDKRIDVLRGLDGIVPESELAPAIYLTQPEPEWKADARKLQALARKYGGKVREIVEAGLVDVYSRPVLVIERRDGSIAPVSISEAHA